MKKIIIVSAFILLGVASYAQGKKQGLTDAEKIKVLSAQLNICKAQTAIDSMNASTRALISQIEANHDGMTIDLNTGELTEKKAPEKKETPKAEKEK